MPVHVGAPAGSRRWLAGNMTGAERIVRMLGAVLLLAVALVVLPGWVHGVGGVLSWVFVGAGVVDLAVSGAIGFCPVYLFVTPPWVRRGAR